MNWIKRGLIYGPDGTSAWAEHSALQPTPFSLTPSTIRVFAGFRDREGMSRVGWVDVDAEDPAQVRGVSETPALDIGRPGAFDDNGVVPCAAVRRGDEIWLYYAGYQLCKRAKFLVFGGLATSSDGGNSFQRYSKAPIFDRTSDETLFRVVHCVRHEGGRWRIWYCSGDEWVPGPGRDLPVYDTKYVESADGIIPNGPPQVAVSLSGDENRIGRPTIVNLDGRYHMYFTTGTPGGGLGMGYAVSDDGVVWTRCDSEGGIGPSESGWDSHDICYGCLLEHGEHVYLFYNGNNYGREGFGFAELDRRA